MPTQSAQFTSYWLGDVAQCAYALAHLDALDLYCVNDDASVTITRRVAAFRERSFTACTPLFHGKRFARASISKRSGARFAGGSRAARIATDACSAECAIR